jgi:long-chain acyl-CoA synthetase
MTTIPLARRRWGSEVSHGPAGKVYTHRPRCLSDLLGDIARWGERTALVAGQRRISFGDHISDVNEVAAALVGRGLRPGGRVVLLAGNSPEWVTAFWAVAQAGGVLVLANAWWSAQEIEDALDTIGPELVFADEERRQFVPSRCAVIPMSAVRDMVDGEPRVGDVPTHVAQESDPAIILFTSGTEGAAKAVVLNQRSVVANVQNLLVRTRRLPSELSDDHHGTVSLMCLPLFHIGGIQSFVCAQLSGGRLLFLDGRFDPEEVLTLIEREQVRFFGGVPTMVARVLDSPNLQSYNTSSLVSIALGGSLVVPELAEKIKRGFPSAQHSISSVYGQTESGGALTAAGGTDLLDRPGCVGKPLPTAEIMIADPDDEGVGEVYARAPTLMSGFTGAPAHTVSPIDDAGWLHTGDLGRIDSDGYLYIVGRSRDIIIRGGENIAPGHVENRLLKHPAVLDVSVVGLPHQGLGEEVGAAVVTFPQARVESAELASFAAAALARFEVPTRWWISDTPFPLNGTGKVVKRQIVEAWVDTQTTVTTKGACQRDQS